MRRVFPWLSLILAALWLPATLHCALETVGVFEEACATPCGSDGVPGTDTCATVENGGYHSLADLAQAPIPQLLAARFLGVLLTQWESARPDAELIEATPERAADWNSTWCFVRRAAPLARAPSCLVA